MQNEQTLAETTSTPAVTAEQETLGGLSIRTNLRAGVGIDEIQGQVSSWWQNLSSSLSLSGAP